ncbi:RDD family protein [Jiangella rhizosphaerae]|uniref:RDD family protein n=1 Tax=Jiangella rhizosphaerae TaxID=2293569 RepID=A0A418KK00_9ACTN|nr:RDD family protein [Jiangella rhizosphaerae]RIQ15678.1 RDD family protein [Jiangella rhizosphaerae]
MSSDRPTSPDLQLPDHGPGSPAGWGRRFAALLLDWIAGNLVAFIVTGGDSGVWDAQSGVFWLPLICWYLLVVVSTTLSGGSLGQLMLGLRVAHLGGRRISPVIAAVRTLMIALVIPPLVFTRDGRGLHDLASNTVVVNAR